MQQAEAEDQPRQRPPKKSSKDVKATEIVVSLVIIGILLVFLFVPFMPMSDYTVVKRPIEYLASGSTTWPEIGFVKTKCGVIIKDGGVGGIYAVTFYDDQHWNEKTSKRYISSGATGEFEVVFSTPASDFSYDITAPEGLKSVIQIIAGK
jgi:hypothetical protein